MESSPLNFMNDNQLSSDIESLQSHLLFLSIDSNNSPEKREEGRIQQKIDSNNLSIIKWEKIKLLVKEAIDEFKFCFYELRIYNADSFNESSSTVLNKVKEIGMELNLNGYITKVKQGLYGIFFEFYFEPYKNINEGKLLEQKKFNEVKIGTFGEENSGKSTTLSVISNEKLDDGNGSMRVKNFRFQHEIQTGKTLSVSHIILGYDTKGNKIQIDEKLAKEDKVKKLEMSSKIINLYDLGGSEKAMKITLSLISPNYIDYALLFLDPTQGLTENTKMFYTLNNSIHIPMIFIITKADKVTVEELKKTKEEFFLFSSKIMPFHNFIEIKEEKDISNYHSVPNNNSIPLFEVSNLNGQGLDILIKFLGTLQNTLTKTIPLLTSAFEEKYFTFSSSPKCQFDIHEHFIVDGKAIIAGFVSKGKIIKGEQYFFGPNKLGNFKSVIVESIHCKKESVDIVYEGQFSSLCITGKNYNPDELRKGNCLIGSTYPPQSAFGFKADIWSIGNEGMKEVKYKYEPMVIIDHIRQICKIKKPKSNEDLSLNGDSASNSEFTESTSRITDNDDLSEGGRRKKKGRHLISRRPDESYFISTQEKIELLFAFKNYPEYITEGSNVIIGDKNLRALGIVTKVFYSPNLKE
ncbi:MAG: GTP-binding protein [archaeon]|nr:GTP-binding protein [archaeon]